MSDNKTTINENSNLQSFSAEQQNNPNISNSLKNEKKYVKRENKEYDEKEEKGECKIVKHREKLIKDEKHNAKILKKDDKQEDKDINPYKKQIKKMPN